MRDPNDVRVSVSEEVREIDRALRRLARRQATLDVELLAWLRRAEEENIWPQLGYVHALEYLEDVFAFAPRTATDRLRVANELGELPQIEKALANGELAFGAVRELTRVATTETEARWLARARGQRLREVERLVAGHKKGDDPDDKPDPNRIRHGVWLELDGESMAAWRQLRAMLDDELGEKVDDRTVVLEIARRCLEAEGVANDDGGCGVRDELGDFVGGEGTGADTGGRETGGSETASETGDVTVHGIGERENGNAGPGKTHSARPRHMVHNLRCSDCRRAWQLGAGAAIEISSNALARIECDAVIVDEETGERAAWTIPPATRRKVMMRDHGCCQFPGCRAARFLDVHHILHRAHGGTNDEWNLLVLCAGHHRLHHDGILEISGRAPDQVRFVRDGIELLTAAQVPAHVRLLGDNRELREPVPVRRVSNENAELATVALTTAGYKRAIAKRAVEMARAHVGAENLEGLIREALRQCL